LLLHDPARAAWNMAVDTVLLELAERPTLRLYGWSPGAVSVGRSQAARLAAGGAWGALAARAREAGLELVVRPTGGGALLHRAEVTYAVVVPIATLPGRVSEAFALITGAIKDGLAGIDLELDQAEVAGSSRDAVCLLRAGAGELTWQGRKVVAGAQARRGANLLQHGVIPLHFDAGRHTLVLGPLGGGEAVAAGLDEIAGGAAPAEAGVREALVRGFAERFGVTLVESALTAAEVEAARRHARELVLAPRVAPLR
jgi:lipoate-protein ligase A